MSHFSLSARTFAFPLMQFVVLHFPNLFPGEQIASKPPKRIGVLDQLLSPFKKPPPTELETLVCISLKPNAQSGSLCTLISIRYHV